MPGGRVTPNQNAPRAIDSKRTQLYIDAERYRLVKIIAAVENKTITDTIHDAIDLLLDKKAHQTAEKLEKF